MSTNSPIYRAILTLSPAEAEGKVSMRLELHEQDTIDANGTLKPLRDCTIDELKVFADQLEDELSAAWAAQTVDTLIADPDVSVAISDDQHHILDYIILLPEEERADESQIDELEIALINDVPEIEDVGEEAAASDDEDSADLEPRLEAEQDAHSDEIQIEDATRQDAEPTPALRETIIAVDEAELIHDEPEEAETPTDLTRDPEPSMRTAGILPSGKYPDKCATIIWLDERPLRIMQGHAKSSMRREVAGVMLGPRPEKQPDGRYLVHVKDMIVAKHTRMSGASVTYTPESWRYMNDKLADKYPNGDMVMVGWYHTHPGFGIFLSNMDLFIHTNFFTQKWHIAYVLDPVGERSGFFSWDRPKSQVIPYGFAWPEWAARSW